VGQRIKNRTADDLGNGDSEGARLLLDKFVLVCGQVYLRPCHVIPVQLYDSGSVCA
jgi:hypothetical protein